MEKYVEFRGLKHYPIGNARLELIGDKLKVMNFGKDLNNGYYVELPQEIRSINTIVEPFEFLEETLQTFSSKMIVGDKEQDVGNISFSKKEGKIIMNGEQFGEDFLAQAYLEGKVIYQWKPEQHFVRAPWLLIAYIVSNTTLYYQKTESAGTTRHEVGGNWNGRVVSVDTNDGKRFETDRVTVSNTIELVRPTSQRIEFRAANFKELVIADYQINIQ